MFVDPFHVLSLALLREEAPVSAGAEPLGYPWPQASPGHEGEPLPSTGQAAGDAGVRGQEKGLPTEGSGGIPVPGGI